MINRMLRQHKNSKIEEGKKKPLLKIVYKRDSDKEMFEVTDDNPETRKNSFAVAPSHYAPGAVNYKITNEDITKYPKLKGIALSGDIVSKEDFDNFVL